MSIVRGALLALLTLVAWLAVPPRAAGSAHASVPSSSGPRTIRVLYLKDTNVGDVVQRLRSEVRIRSLATIEKPAAVVISDTGEQVARATDLLRERGDLARWADPHAPLDFDRFEELPETTRELRLVPGAAAQALGLLRSVYRIRELAELAGDRISGRAPEPVLDAAAALLAELGLLAAPAAPARTPGT